MININIESKTYTYDELKALFNKFSDREDDFEDFINAMQLTGQLKETKGGKFRPTQISEVKTLETLRYETLTTVLAGGKKEVPFPRVGIHGLKTKTRTIPTEMKIIKYKDTKGNWIDIPERPSLVARRPRESERWRAEIPAEIRRKYNIKLDQEVRIAIGSVSFDFFSKLRLWGYSIQAMITFGQTGGHKSDRDLELHGWNFAYEAKPNLREQMDRMGDNILNALRSWLERYDIRYYETFMMGGANQDEIKSPEIIEGMGPTPLISQIKGASQIQFRDTQKGRNIASATGKLPKNWFEIPPDGVASLFTFSTDDIGFAHGYMGRVGKGRENYTKLKTKQVTLDQLKAQKEGFKKRKK